VKFAYPNLSTVVYKEQRWYDTPLGFFPSITTILGSTEPEEKKQSLKRWQESLGALAAQKTKQAADRGTTVHLLCERYLKGEKLDDPINGSAVSQADMQSFNALRPKLDKIEEVWGQEVALYSPSLELAGRCDLVAVYKGVPAIIDYKTSSRLKRQDDIADYKNQVCFYGTAHNELFGTNITEGFIFMVAESGFPMEFKVRLPDHLPELRERAKRFWAEAINKVS
jgi:genome maintenance exonuclease 1